MTEPISIYNYLSTKDYTKIGDFDLRNALRKRYALRIIERANARVDERIFEWTFGERWSDLPYSTLFRLAKAAALKDKPYERTRCIDSVRWGANHPYYVNTVRRQLGELDSSFARALCKFYGKKPAMEFMTKELRFGEDTYGSYCSTTARTKALLEVAIGCKRFYPEGLGRLKKLGADGMKKLHEKYYYQRYNSCDVHMGKAILGEERYGFVFRTFYKTLLDGINRGKGDDWVWDDVTANAINHVWYSCGRATWGYENARYVSQRIVKYYGILEHLVEARAMLDEMGMTIENKNRRRHPSRLSGKLYKLIKTTYKSKQDDAAKRETLRMLSESLCMSNYNNTVFSPAIITKEA